MAVTPAIQEAGSDRRDAPEAAGESFVKLFCTLAVTMVPKQPLPPGGTDRRCSLGSE